MSAPLPRVVVAHWTHPEVLAYLRRFSDPVSPLGRTVMDPDELLRESRDAQALIVGMSERIDADFLAQCPHLRVVAAVLKGYDNFDVAAFAARQIWFTVAPDLLTIPTAELTLGLILALTRNVRLADRAVRAGEFAGWRPR